MPRFGSLFAGIGGFDLALREAGWDGAYACEIDPQCNAVRQRHWDEETIEDVRDVEAGPSVGLVCAGWPCQGNSVAGRRAGMADERSGLWSEVVRVLAAQRPRWFFGENVPGILSVNGGGDWLAVLRGLAELGYGFAYRILDAQWFGVAQRRRRVFVVGCLGDWRRAAEVLFERESLPWDSAPSREAGTSPSGTVTQGFGSGGPCPERVGMLAFGGNNTRGPVDVATACNAKGSASGRQDFESETFVACPLTLVSAVAVRRLTPTECERLQGFPDGWTEGPSDSARYRMLGNAVAVPVVRWIVDRITDAEDR